MGSDGNFSNKNFIRTEFVRTFVKNINHGNQGNKGR